MDTPNQPLEVDKKAEDSRTTRNSASTPTPVFSSRLPPSLEADRIGRQDRDFNYLSQLQSQPIVTTLSAFSHVANFVRNPYELINNVDEFVRHATNRQRLQHDITANSSNIAQTLNQNRSATLNSPTSVRELDTFMNDSHNVPASDDPTENQDDSCPYQSAENELPIGQLPIPTLPPIDCSHKRGRLQPLTIEEYELKFRQSSTDLELIDRIFYGGIATNQLRSALWPYLFGLVEHRGHFEEISNPEGQKVNLFVEHQGNYGRWAELQKLYHSYQSQWKSITPDQEQRFSAFREKKSLIDRDVIRCDRLHAFYAEKPQNLHALTNMLMTYMMYDFDIGYVQGMSDLAGPILFMYNGDIVKAFWIFVEVMKLFRRNFELTQKTIHFQLACLSELIKQTDPLFAQYLGDREVSNCFFAFRAIVCLFKRELMKEDEDDYQKVLFLWDTIWCVQRRQVLIGEIDGLVAESFRYTTESHCEGVSDSKIPQPAPDHLSDDPYYTLVDSIHADTPRRKLFETELFVLALCLSMIRRERDLVMARQLDSTDIHLHFIDPKLAKDLDSFIEHAINIYSYLKNDFDLSKLTPQCNTTPTKKTGDAPDRSESPPGSMGDGYDLLTDLLVVQCGDR